MGEGPQPVERGCRRERVEQGTAKPNRGRRRLFDLAATEKDVVSQPFPHFASTIRLDIARAVVEQLAVRRSRTRFVSALL